MGVELTGGLLDFSAMATGGVGGFAEEPGGTLNVVDGGGLDNGMSWGGGPLGNFGSAAAGSNETPPRIGEGERCCVVADFPDPTEIG
jgi:hypothetical protein